MFVFEPFNPLAQVEDQNSNPAKTQIRNLFDSYNGEWDIIIELLQNSIDALEAKFAAETDFSNERPEIDIYINQEIDLIRISDNGIGIIPDDAKKVLAPNFTKKDRTGGRNSKRFRGHKGVGLTYIAYSSNNLKYATKSTMGEFIGEISGARAWVLDNENTEPAPMVRPIQYNPGFYATHRTGTTFEVQLDSRHLSKKNINWLAWEYVIRNYTAIGFCAMSAMPEWAKNVKVNFKLIDIHGQEVQPPVGKSSQIDFKYQFPNEIMNPVVDLKKLLTKYRNQASIPQSEKNKYEGMFQRWDTNEIKEFIKAPEWANFIDQYNAHIYGFFVHTAAKWRVINENLTVDKRRKFWRPGIQVVTENMPTGRVIDIDLSFGGGNEDRAFFVIELDGARPDYGRKTFDEMVNRFVQAIASRIVRHFVANRELLINTKVAHGGTRSQQQYTSDLRIEAVRELEDLGIPNLPFIKVPQYEQDVVGLFSMLVGANVLKGYQVLSVSSGAQYDAVVKYLLEKQNQYFYDAETNILGIIPQCFSGANSIRTVPKNMEFKYYLSDLIAEFNPNDPSAKIFDDIFWAVAWDIGDEDAYSSAGYHLEDLTENNAFTKREYWGVTRLLFSQSSRPIHVILLKDVVKLLRRHN